VGGNAVKATDPLFESPVIGVDVLNMNCAFDTFACAQVDGVVSDALILCKVAVSRVAMGVSEFLCARRVNDSEGFRYLDLKI
jgi:hypothetical protein